MTLEPVTDLSATNGPASAGEFPVRGWWRLIYGSFVVLIPAFSFWAVQIIKPEWQSGDRQAFLALLLTPEASIGFLLLLAYSVLCYLLLLAAPERSADWFPVRLGIYGGTILAFQYSIILFVYLFDNRYIYAIFLLWLLPLYVPRLYRWAVRRWNTGLVVALLAILAVAGLVIGLSIAREFIFILVLGLVIAGPFWSLLIAIQAFLWLVQRGDSGTLLPRGLGVGAWLAGYVAAWRYDILKMYEMYAELPLVPPDCYLATAAAHGHPRFVGSWRIQLANGEFMRANRQLQIFKYAELAVKAVAPRLHAILRALYDAIGQRLARRIQHPLLADVAYLLLKPFEWTARLILRRLVPEIASISIYN
jgi:hypothetical protein